MLGTRMPRGRWRCRISDQLARRRFRIGRICFDLFLAALAVVSMLASGAMAKETGGRRPKLPAGTSNRIVRAQAVNSLPMDQLTPPAQRKIRRVVANASVYRRVPASTIKCDPSFEVFLLRNPNVVIDIWKLMGITRLDMVRTGKFNFDTSDGMGTNCHMDLVYSRPDLHLYYAKGVYEGSLSPSPIHGECVVVLKCRFSRAPDGSPLATNQMDVFLRLEGAALDFLAKTFHPLFGKSVDVNFWETAEFIERLSLTAKRNPRAVAALANRLDEVQPEVREQFAEIVTSLDDHLYSRSARSPLTQRENRPDPATRSEVKQFETRDHRSRTQSVTHVSRYPPDGPLLR